MGGTATNTLPINETLRSVSPGTISKKKKSVRRKPKKLMPLGQTPTPKKFQNVKPPVEGFVYYSISLLILRKYTEERVAPPKSDAAKYTFDLNYCQLIIEVFCIFYSRSI